MNYGSKVQFVSSDSELQYFDRIDNRANNAKLILNSSIRCLLNSYRLIGTYVVDNNVSFTDKIGLIRLMMITSRCNES